MENIEKSRHFGDSEINEQEEYEKQEEKSQQEEEQIK